MDELLRILLERLEAIGDQHNELFDSEVREAMSDAIVDGFVRRRGVAAVPEGFGMFSNGADAQVHDVIHNYVASANATASNIGMTAFQVRLSAFQNSHVRTSRGNYYDDFFGHSPAEQFDAAGNAISI